MNFSNRIKSLREQKGLLQRQLAAKLEIDTPMYSKIERGERRAKREHVILMSQVFETPKEDLLTLWLADKVYNVVKDENIAENALKVAEEVLKYLKPTPMLRRENIDSHSIKEPLGLFPSDISIKPFLKWAGGKTQLLPSLSTLVPIKFNKYIEPFIGGGAFYFHLNPSKAVIADANEELIITYTQVRDNVEDVIKILDEYQNQEDYYYRIRSLDVTLLNPIKRAARLIYLNKTCFNGLFRVNKKGHFNVPYGKRTGSFFNKETLYNASEFLQNTIIEHADYLTSLKKHAQKGDFVFLDPPYYPISEYSDFKRYTKEFFYHEDHVKLKEEFDRLVNIGCHVLLTNSDHPVIIELFKDYEILVIETKRLISRNPKTRVGKDIIVIGRNE